jgi:hypothetical protein
MHASDVLRLASSPDIDAADFTKTGSDFLRAFA